MERELQDTIAKAAEACRLKDAEQFAALFSSDAELILATGEKINGRDAIARMSADYFATCEEIRIEIRDIRIDGDRAVIYWTWDSRDRAGTCKHRENKIELNFCGQAIVRWQETIEG